MVASSATSAVHMKTCFKCGVTQPLESFYKHPGTADGRLGKCKSCAKADVAANRAKNIDYYRAYDSERAKLPERAKAAAAISKAWRQEDSRRMAAHNKVTRAVRTGGLVRQPCCVCGSEKSMAHHESYDRPLEVVWYCQVHHKARHKQMAIEGIEP
jgi:hypothetical protein